MCVLSRPLRSGDVLKSYGGTKKNNLNKFLTSDEIDTDIDLSSSSPYVSIDGLPDYLSDVRDNLSFFSLNAQSLPAKFNKIKIALDYWLNEKSISFSSLNFTESWLKSDNNGEVDTTHYQLEGYQEFASGATCSTHGGVISYIKDDLEVKIELKHGSRFFDGIFLSVKGEGIKPFLLCNIYRAPKTNLSSIESFLQEFTPIMQTFEKKFKNIVVCGDFNLNLIKVNEHEKYSDFLYFMLSIGLCPKITLPTRFAKHSASLLDLIFIRTEDDFLRSTTKSGILHSAISDHCGCFSVLKTPEPPKKGNTYVEIMKTDQNALGKFSDALKGIDLISSLDTDLFSDPNLTYIKLEAALLSCIKTHLPTKRVKFNKYKHKKSDWITFGLLKSILTRDNLYRRWKSKHPDSILYTNLQHEFNEYSSHVDKLIKIVKADYYQKEFEKFKGDIKKTWRMINSILNRNRKVNNFPSYIIGSNGKITDKQEIVNELNNYFCNIGQILADSIPSSNHSYSHYLKKLITSSFSFSTVDSETVLKILKQFKPKTSKGIDGISMKILKSVSSIILDPLTLLINQSLMTSTFPSKLKIAKIMPLLKKPNIFKPDNFRPISLLPCISKIIEKCVFIQIYEYFEKNKLIFGSQYGYRKNHSTETACLELIDKLYKHLDNNQSPFCIFIDLSKAFDTINHQILLSKLKYYGLDDHAISWFKSYLSDRKQFVEVDGVKSPTQPISTGVPQGSTLGPLLFVIYMNDINIVSEIFKCILFADDTSLESIISLFPARTTSGISRKVNDELSNLIDWLRANKLSLNVKKTKYMQFRYPQKSPSLMPKLTLKMNNTPIEKVTHFDFLGLRISETLSWKDHIDKVKGKISKIAGSMYRIKNQVNSKILLAIYNSLILSHLHYGILCWGFQGHHLFKLQKRAVRTICKTKYNAHTDPLFKKLKLLKVMDIFKTQCLKFFKQLNTGKLPHYFLSNFKFTRSCDIHNRPLRNTNVYRVEHTNRHMSRNTIRHYIPTLLNETDKSLLNYMQTHSILSAKRKIKNNYLGFYKIQCDKAFCYVCRK